VRSSPAPPRQKFFSRYQIVKDRYPRRVPSRVGRGRVRVFHSSFGLRHSHRISTAPLPDEFAPPRFITPPPYAKTGSVMNLRHPEFITRGIRPPPKLCPLCHPPPGAPPSWVSPLSPFGFLLNISPLLSTSIETTVGTCKPLAPRFLKILPPSAPLQIRRSPEHLPPHRRQPGESRLSDARQGRGGDTCGVRKQQISLTKRQRAER